MSIIIKTGLIIITLLGLSVTNIEASEAPSIEQQIQEAENGRLEAKKLGFEWSTTSILIENAKKSFESGDNAAASTYAKKAINEARLSLIQAEYAAQNWKKYAL